MIDITSPFSYENRDRFTFTKSEKNIVKQLEYLFENGYGINIVYGNRGVGKTTLKNYAKHEILEKKYSNIIVIDVPEYLEDAEFYSYILESLINQMKLEIKQIIEHYRYPSYLGMQLVWDETKELDEVQLIKKLRCVQIQVPPNEKWASDALKREIAKYNDKNYELQKRIENLFKKRIWKNKQNYPENRKIQVAIERDKEKIVELSKWYQYESYQYELLELQQIFDAEVVDNKIIEEYESEEQGRKSNIDASERISVVSPVFASNISIGRSQINHSKTGVNCTGSSMITHKLTFQYKKKKFTDILKKMQSDLNLRVNVCIDELDKCSVIEISGMINRNKSFFLESGVTTFLILNLGNGILFKEIYSDYITSYVLCKNLSMYEFFVKSSNQGKRLYNDFFELLKGYCSVRGNNRNLLVKKMKERNVELSESILFVYLWQSEFYQKLTEDYKELFNNFFDVLIENLKLLGELHKSDFSNLVLEFKERYDISSVKLDLLFNQLERVLYHKKLNQKFLFMRMWENGFSHKLKYTKYEGTNFYEAFEKYFNRVITDLKILIIEDSKLVLNCSLSYKIITEFEILLQQYNTTMSDIMDIFRDVSGMKNNHEFLRNVRKNIRYSDQETYSGVDDAMKTIERWRNEIIGVVFFYPKDRSGNVLLNGVIYRYNNFGEIVCIPYMGYIGLHSHKPNKMEKLKQFLTKNNVCFKEVEDLNEELFQKSYEQSNDSEEEIIKKLCLERNYLKRWLELIPTY
ncbi:hypothetical protein [Enterococcus sp. 5H]|uniref:hypothetical protein n=1 Tax=Enterococcus sp. 5H TaxID=1229490 RepID=UPI002302E698|nr:hypothetical protein [Enterococcus sp. 5H]MDA9471946.1 hypothetical protein [Enterococcus sp. 5H]